MDEMMAENKDSKVIVRMRPVVGGMFYNVTVRGPWGLMYTHTHQLRTDAEIDYTDKCRAHDAK